MSQRLTAGFLERRGHSVEVVGNGRQALDALDAGAFDAVLMDLEMPEVDGVEATAAIRDLERVSGEQLPIIALTAYVTTVDRDRSFQAGADGFLAKPVKPAELYAAIEGENTGRAA